MCVWLSISLAMVIKKPFDCHNRMARSIPARHTSIEWMRFGECVNFEITIEGRRNLPEMLVVCHLDDLLTFVTNGFAETHFNKFAVISRLRIQIAVLISETVKWWSLMARWATRDRMRAVYEVKSPADASEDASVPLTVGPIVVQHKRSFAFHYTAMLQPFDWVHFKRNKLQIERAKSQTVMSWHLFG